VLTGTSQQPRIAAFILSGYRAISTWYSWVDSNHRPPDPQSGALTN
jgi:hypothetical protein